MVPSSSDSAVGPSATSSLPSTPGSRSNGRKVRRASPVSPRSAERLLPHSDEAEVAVLGALLLDNALLDGIDLGAEDFYRSGHAAVLRAIRFLRASSTVADLVTVGEAMGLREVPSRLRSPDGVREGLPYLASLTDGVPRSASIAS